MQSVLLLRIRLFRNEKPISLVGLICNANVRYIEACYLNNANIRRLGEEPFIIYLF